MEAGSDASNLSEPTNSPQPSTSGSRSVGEQLNLEAIVVSNELGTLVSLLEAGTWNKRDLVQHGLFAAARHRRWEALSVLLDHGVPVNRYDEHGQSVLHVLLSQGSDVPDEDIAQALRKVLACGSAQALWQSLVNKPEKNTGATSLHRAVQHQRARCVEELLRVGARTESGAGFYRKTPLIMAAGAHQADIVQMLLDAGAVVNKSDVEGNHPLCFAAKAGSVPCMEKLIAARGGLNLANHSGVTPLMYAAMGGYVDCVRFLLEKGADVTQRDFFGRSVLRYAVKSRMCQVLRLILEHMEEISDEDIDPAVANGAVEMDELEMLHLLIDRRWDFSPTDPEVGSVLHRAAEMGSLRCLQVLLDKKEDLSLNVNLQNRKYGFTALYYACAFGHHEAVSLLLQHGACHDIECLSGTTPIFAAMRILPIPMMSERGMHCIKELLQWGCNVNFVGKVKPEGHPRIRLRRTHVTTLQFTPLDYALCGKNLTAAKFLVLAGGKRQYTQNYWTLSAVPRDAPDLLPSNQTCTDAEFQDFVSANLQQTQPLASLCRTAIRESLVCDVPGRVGGLMLPTHIKEYLTLPELDELLEQYKAVVCVESEEEEDEWEDESSDEPSDDAIVVLDSEDSDSDN